MRDGALGRWAARLLAAMLLASSCMVLNGQTAPAAGKEPEKNPFSGDAKAIRQGELLFRENCIYCHGLGAHGGSRGPDLTTGAWVHGGSDGDLRRTISQGVPGTAMPPNDLPDEEIWQIVSYLRSIQVPVAAPVGNAKHGETIFFGDGNCSLCHMVNGRGGRVGPELSRAGAARSRAYLVESIREPSKQLTHNRNFAGSSTFNYDTVTVVTRDGRTITGVPLNEDTFSVQLMDRDEKLYSFLKRDLKSYTREPKSIMPAYKPDVLSDHDLQDLVAYLQTLRGAQPGAPGGANAH